MSLRVAGVVGVLLGGALLAPNACAQEGSPGGQSEGEWVLLVERALKIAKQNEEIPVNALRAACQKVRIQVEDAPLEIGTIQLRFGNKEKQMIAVNATLQPGQSTSEFDLEGDVRFINRLRIQYKAKGLKRPKIKLYGTQNWWVPLGSVEAQLSAERCEIVPSEQATIHSIRLAVEQNGVEILELKVHFPNGEVFPVTVAQHIAKNGLSRVIDLPGGGRIVSKIEVLYRTKGIHQGLALLKLLGHKTLIQGGGDQAWKPLGKRFAPLKQTQVKFGGLGLSGQFRRLRLQVINQELKLVSATVTFGNNETHTVPFDQVLAPGAFSPEIPLPGHESLGRNVKRVNVNYEKTENTKGLPPPVIELSGN